MGGGRVEGGQGERERKRERERVMEGERDRQGRDIRKINNRKAKEGEERVVEMAEK